MSLKRHTYTTAHVFNISFIIAVSSLISFNEMKEYAIVKDLSYSDVVYMSQEKNLDATGISERSVRLFCTSNNIRKQPKKELQKKIFLYASKA